MVRSSCSSSLSTDYIKGLILGVALSATGSLLLFQRCKSLSKKKLVSQEDPEELGTSDNEISSSSVEIKIPPSMRAEQISRTALYFPETISTHITKASILVLGCGGVGSHAAISLARSGVRHLRLVDMDMVTLSSLNRHACATLKDVGTPKVETLKKTIAEISGGGEHCEVEAVCEMYTGNRNDLLDYNFPNESENDDKNKQWDFVVDAIDDIPTKADLLAECYRRKIHVISCMGAAGKADPTRLHMSDLNGASRDPLASKLRQRLKKIDPQIAYSDLVTVVYSSEKVVMKLADFTPEQKEQGVENFGAIDGMRVRVLPVLGSMPAIMGQACAAFALCEVGDKAFSPVSGERLGKSVRHKALQHFKNRESKIREEIESTVPESQGNETKDENNDSNSDGIPSGKVINGVWVGPVQIDMNDADFLLSTQWKQKCCITGAKLGTVLELVRWDMSKPSTADNLVLMSIKCIQKLDSTKGWNKDEVFDPEVIEKVEKRMNMFKDD